MDGVEQYQTTAVTTQSKGRLIVMLYDGAVKFLKLAIEEIEKKNPDAKGQYIIKAKDIINELPNPARRDYFLVESAEIVEAQTALEGT